MEEYRKSFRHTHINAAKSSCPHPRQQRAQSKALLQTKAISHLLFKLSFSHTAVPLLPLPIFIFPIYRFNLICLFQPPFGVHTVVSLLVLTPLYTITPGPVTASWHKIETRYTAAIINASPVSQLSIKKYN